MHNHILQTVVFRILSVVSHAEQSPQWGFDVQGDDGVVEHGKGILQSYLVLDFSCSWWVFFIKIRQEFLTSENIVGCFLMHDLEGL